MEITQPFYMGMYAVTQEEYKRVMGNNPSYFSATGDGKAQVQGMDTSRFPVEQVPGTTPWSSAANCPKCRKKRQGASCIACRRSAMGIRLPGWDHDGV